MAEQTGPIPDFIIWAVIIAIFIIIAVFLVYWIVTGSAPTFENLIGSGKSFNPKWP